MIERRHLKNVVMFISLCLGFCKLDINFYFIISTRLPYGNKNTLYVRREEMPESEKL